MAMPDSEKKELAAKAKRLEKKQLFVKAAEIYLKVGDKEKAASAYESACDYKKAEAIFMELGCESDAARCRDKRINSISDGSTWETLQKKYQDEAGNPY